ncbi:UDP-galactopyranose mutase [Sphingomonas sp. RB1R13]|uniref:UDP-galactopyranose mutase n=1 Tax=Sphingomonas sp. RB1R13 TaxID=3096159 RepID=UPI002FCA77DA
MITGVGVSVGSAGEALRPPEHAPMILCFSHLRWEFVFQRPQHLLTRFARKAPVVVWEEPIDADDGASPSLHIRPAADCAAVTLITPRLPPGGSEDERDALLRQLLDGYLARIDRAFVAWYYTPIMLSFSAHLKPACTVYDAMDELANFRFAPPKLLDLERQLLERADVVFTGGYSLYESKKQRHGNVHPFPSSVDVAHFAQARAGLPDPADQAALAHPRLGFYGVFDERIDLDLIAAVADARPDWLLVMVGPVVKISEDELPRRDNIHWLGGRSYNELPAYLGGWDVALMPFAINAATRFISPTKTPEYLAAGVPVVSTPIRDVKRHYERIAGVRIAGTAEQFIAGCEAQLALRKSGDRWLAEVDGLLSTMSWDITQARMAALIDEVIAKDIAADTRPAIAMAPSAIGHIAATRKYDYLIVGCGFAGSVLAERLANQHGARILMIDKRDHIAGNAFDEKDAAGILMHRYGPHIFHTNSDEVFAYLSSFTNWRAYEHRVLASVRDKLVPIPINRTTLNELFDLDLKTDAEAAEYLASRAETVDEIQTSEDVVINAVGRELYELFFRGYTRKQWGLDPSELDKLVTARIPTRTNTDDRYFTDKHQAMPADGYTAMFKAMLDHPNIDIALGADFNDLKDEVEADHIIYTGPIDEYFDFRFGKLPYRSLKFEHRTLDQTQYQSVGTVNYPSEDIPYTRISEYKHLTGQSSDKTSITLEYPSAEGDPYYPIPRPENQALFKRYEALADATTGVTFVGRLATYRYYNMDQIVGQALATFRRIDTARKAKLGATTAPASSSEYRIVA